MPWTGPLRHERRSSGRGAFLRRGNRLRARLLASRRRAGTRNLKPLLLRVLLPSDSDGDDYLCCGRSENL